MHYKFLFLGYYHKIFTLVSIGLIPSVVFPQMIGSFIMGFINPLKYSSFKVGISSGLCGSITSFSSVILAVYQSLNMSGLLDGLSIILITVSFSICSYKIGFHLGSLKEINYPIKILNFRIYMFALTLIDTTGVLALCILKPSPLIFSLLIGPVGSICRFFLSKLNSLKFPLGTFISNISATAFLGFFYILNSCDFNENDCKFIYAASFGFCGCLSTFSSFIAELYCLDLKNAYLYGVLSFVASLIFLWLILGLWGMNHNIYFTPCFNKFN